MTLQVRAGFGRGAERVRKKSWGGGGWRGGEALAATAQEEREEREEAEVEAEACRSHDCSSKS
jgi:hypothetical protein